jgi:V8-like Glu-specific endopeptidase
LLLATIGVAVLLASGAALGITGGVEDGELQPDGSYKCPSAGCKYPEVGALADLPDGGAYCTGTLISETVFVTAAHCYPLPEGDPAYVSFDPSYDITKPEMDAIKACNQNDQCTKHWTDFTNETEYSGEFIDDDRYDIAVVKFAAASAPPSTIPPAQLPTLDQVTKTVTKGAKFTPVGYGDTSGYNFDGGVRRYAPWTTFKSVNRTYLSTSQHRGSGGTCYGDSGGPNFFGTAEQAGKVIAGITITGDTWCKATNVTLRLDTKPVRAFLKPYGVLPDPNAQ